jgi:AcrR family transcriptional regulator
MPTSEEILQAAADLMRTGGIDAISTRALAGAAGVQPPVIYRLFGDKKRLLDAVTHFVFEKYLAEKRRLIATYADPLRELEQLWDLHVDFGLTHPHCYLHAYVPTGHETASACAAQSFALLQDVVAQLGNEGRLRISVERATGLMRSAAMGIVLALIPLPPHQRDLRLSRTLRDSTLSTIVHDEPDLQTRCPDLPARAVALHEELSGPYHSTLTLAERTLLSEWLTRLVENT